MSREVTDENTTVPAGQSPDDPAAMSGVLTKSRWPLVIASLAWLGWIGFLVAMLLSLPGG